MVGFFEAERWCGFTSQVPARTIHDASAVRRDPPFVAAFSRLGRSTCRKHAFVPSPYENTTSNGASCRSLRTLLNIPDQIVGWEHNGARSLERGCDPRGAAGGPPEHAPENVPEVVVRPS